MNDSMSVLTTHMLEERATYIEGLIAVYLLTHPDARLDDLVLVEQRDSNYLVCRYWLEPNSVSEQRIRGVEAGE